MTDDQLTRAAKRVLDLAVAVAAGVLLAPLALAVAVGLLVTQGRSLLFVQRRAGERGRLFDLYKFRTMAPPSAGYQAADEARLTPAGRLVRRLSLDELPQLWNVLRGDMSIVGPRPLLPEYLERYTPEQWRRHEVPPGITGLAQVSGRNALSWEEKFALDVWYVDHRSLRLDLWIVWRTVVALLRRDGVSAPGHATMPEFMGTRR